MGRKSYTKAFPNLLLFNITLASPCLSSLFLMFSPRNPQTHFIWFLRSAWAAIIFFKHALEFLFNPQFVNSNDSSVNNFANPVDIISSAYRKLYWEKLPSSEITQFMNEILWSVMFLDKLWDKFVARSFFNKIPVKIKVFRFSLCWTWFATALFPWLLK